MTIFLTLLFQSIVSAFCYTCPTVPKSSHTLSTFSSQSTLFRIPRHSEIYPTQDTVDTTHPQHRKCRSIRTLTSLGMSSKQKQQYFHLQDLPDHNLINEGISSPSSSVSAPSSLPSSSPSTSTNKSSSSSSHETSRWLRWMTGGTPRGVAEIKMRDPIALGGVPRSDRYASRDWLHNTINLPNSAILKAIQFPVLSMTFWGALISFLHRKLLLAGRVDLARHMCIPSGPHSLMVSALGLLLVFRTNSAYQRFAVSIFT